MARRELLTSTACGRSDVARISRNLAPGRLYVVGHAGNAAWLWSPRHQTTDGSEHEPGTDALSTQSAWKLSEGCVLWGFVVGGLGVV